MKINCDMTEMLKYANNFKAAILMVTEKKKNIIMSEWTGNQSTEK